MIISYVGFKELPAKEGFESLFKIQNQDFEFNYPIKFHNQLKITWKMVDEEVKDFILDYGLYLLYKRALRGSLDKDGEIYFTPEIAPEKKPILKKQCNFLIQKDNIFLCTTSSQVDTLKGRTTFNACQTCLLPSIHRRCSNIINIQTRGKEKEEKNKTFSMDREIISYKCDDEKTTGLISDCVPEKSFCWELDITAPAKA